MNSDEDLAYVLGARPGNILYIGYFTFNFRLPLSSRRAKRKKGRGLLLTAPNENQSKPQCLLMANF